MVSDAILERLSKEVDTVFLVYGGACAELVDAFTRQTKLRYVCPMHEQAASFMAEGYSKVRGFGVAISTSGPGGLNMVTGIANCYYDSCPVLFITGQVHTKFMRPNESIRQLGFQETPIVDVVKPITKYAAVATENVLQQLDLAIHMAKSGRPGPSLLDIPVDVQRANC